MSIHDNNSQHNRPSQSSYGRINPLASLMNKGISTHQVAGRGASGFRDYSYNKGTGTTGLEGMFSDAIVVSDEQLRQQITDVALMKGNELCAILQRKMGRYYELAKKAISIFPLLDATGQKDPVLVMFTDELLSNVKLYNYCCTYACMMISAKFVDIELSGAGDSFRAEPGNIDNLILNSLLDAFAMEFLQWFEHNPDVTTLHRRLHRITFKRIEKIEGALDKIQYLLGTLEEGAVGNLKIPFPYRRGVIERISAKVFPDSPIFNGETIYGSTANIEGAWESPTYQQHHHSQQRNLGLDWFDDYLSNKEDKGQIHEPYHSHQEDVGPYGTGSTGVWDDTPDTNVDHEKAIAAAQKVTRSNRFNFDFTQWFKRIPSNGKYVIHPDHFMHLSQVLEYDGQGMPYSRSGWQFKGYIPVVELDWDRGLYSYKNVYVGEDNVELTLTNPESVLPKFSLQDETFYSDCFDDYTIELDKAIEESAKRLLEDECRVLSKPPKVVYGNTPTLVDTNEDIVRTVRGVNKLMKTKIDYTPDVLVLPMVSQKAIAIEDTHFDYRCIEEKLPWLVAGNEQPLDIDTFIRETKSGFISIGSRQLAGVVLEHVTRVINRWFVECRFYNDSPDETGHLRIDNAFEDIPELLDKLKQYDPATARELIRFLDNPFIGENIRLFASAKSQEAYIEKATKSITDPLLLEARKEELTQSVLIEKSYALAKITPMAPLNSDRRVSIEGSKNPELIWLADNVPVALKKHFKREVPLVVCFTKDTTFKAWVATRSEFCRNKLSLRKLSSGSIARFRVI